MSTLKLNVMETQTSTSFFKVASITALGLILFFLLMKLLNLITIVELRFVNFFILLIGIRYILLKRRKESQGKLEYLSGMMLGFMTSVMASVLFSCFVFFYLSFIDHTLMQYIITTQPFGSYLSPGGAALIIVAEGAASGAILSFALMHIINKDNANG